MFCHVCAKLLQSGRLVQNKKADPSFITKGFSYWKDATIALKKHASSNCHKETVDSLIVMPSTCPDVTEMLSSQLAVQKKDNRECLLKIIDNLKCLARQGLPFRGDADESDSNFLQLMRFSARNDTQLTEWMKKKTK